MKLYQCSKHRFDSTYLNARQFDKTNFKWFVYHVENKDWYGVGQAIALDNNDKLYYIDLSYSSFGSDYTPKRTSWEEIKGNQVSTNVLVEKLPDKMFRKIQRLLEEAERNETEDSDMIQESRGIVE